MKLKKNPHELREDFFLTYTLSLEHKKTQIH